MAVQEGVPGGTPDSKGNMSQQPLPTTISDHKQACAHTTGQASRSCCAQRPAAGGGPSGRPPPAAPIKGARSGTPPLAPRRLRGRRPGSGRGPCGLAARTPVHVCPKRERFFWSLGMLSVHAKQRVRHRCSLERIQTSEATMQLRRHHGPHPAQPAQADAAEQRRGRDVRFHQRKPYEMARPQRSRRAAAWANRTFQEAGSSAGGSAGLHLWDYVTMTVQGAARPRPNTNAAAQTSPALEVDRRPPCWNIHGGCALRANL